MVEVRKHIEKLGCGGKCLKYFLALLNVIFFLFGLVIAGVSGYSALNSQSTIHQFLVAEDQKLVDGLYILMAVGLLLAFISFLGIWGTLKESRCVLFIYLTFLLLIFALQLAGVIISFVEYKRIEEKIITTLGKPKTNETLAEAAIHRAVDFIEQKFHCCGFTGPSNYGNQPLPEFCYPQVQENADSVTAAANITVPTQPAFTQGCLNTIRPYLYAAGGIGIALLLLQLLVMMFACCLMSDIAKGYEAV